MQKLEILRQLEAFSRLGGLDGLKEIAPGLTEQAAFALAVVGLVLAVLQCFGGYKLLRFWISAAGFTLGYGLGSGLVSALMEKPSRILVIIGGFIGGSVLSFISFKLYLVGVFFYCGILGAALAFQIGLPETGNWGMIRIGIACAAFLAGGILAVLFQRQFIIAISAISGGLSASKALPVIVPEMASDAKKAAAAGLVLAILGAAVQLLTTRSPRKNRKKG